MLGACLYGMSLYPSIRNFSPLENFHSKHVLIVFTGKYGTTLTTRNVVLNMWETSVENDVKTFVREKLNRRNKTMSTFAFL